MSDPLPHIRKNFKASSVTSILSNFSIDMLHNLPFTSNKRVRVLRDKQIQIIKDNYVPYSFENTNKTCKFPTPQKIVHTQYEIIQNNIRKKYMNFLLLFLSNMMR